MSKPILETNIRSMNFLNIYYNVPGMYGSMEIENHRVICIQ